MLGLTSVYREGFETVLFLQSLQLCAGTATVLEGAGLGLAMTLAVGAVTFYFQRKLPYKKMLIVTGVFIGFVLVVMVGQTVRTMQGTGWVPITPIDITLPYWAGLWFGVYPTVETIGAQIAAAVFVIGSYFLAQEMKVKRPRRRRANACRSRSTPERRARTATLEVSGRRSGAHGDALARGSAILSVRPWRFATSAIIVRVERAEPLEHQLAVVEGDDRGQQGRWCGYRRRIARSLRCPISTTSGAAPNSRWISRISKCAASAAWRRGSTCSPR